MIKVKLEILLLLVFSSLTFANNKVIYGEDNRQDPFEVSNPQFLKFANSTAAMIANENLLAKDVDEVLIQSKTLKERGMCETERFVNQPAASVCSGFLVGSDLLITAGHCVNNQAACDKYAWVFDYKVEYSDQSEVIVAKQSVYKCKEIISQKLDQNTLMDYALIKLDREVKDREPLKYRTSGKIQLDTELVVIGYPSGLPVKISDGANIRLINDVYFRANLDTYAGNSGSAVFNIDTGLVEGILVRGDNDYLNNDSKDCLYSNVLANNSGRGEDVTLIANVQGLPGLEEEQNTKPPRKLPWWRRWLKY